MDPNEFRQFGHQLVDQLAEYFAHIEERPLFPDVAPSKVYALFNERVPQDGEPSQAVLQEVSEKLLPYCTHVGHPGYFGLITPTPNLMGILGDFLCSALNQNIGTYSIGPSAVAMERRTVKWLCDIAGYGEGSGGNLTSGGMMATQIVLRMSRARSRASSREMNRTRPVSAPSSAVLDRTV